MLVIIFVINIFFVKQKIEEFNSFDGGYNGTGGNK